MLFFKSYLNICKDLILYWIICESIDFMIAVVVGVLFVFMLLTKFSEKDILLKGVILTLALFIMTYWI